MRRFLVAVAEALAGPLFLAIVTLLAGLALAIAGIFVVFGLGWALIAGSVPLLLLAAVLIKGLLNG